MLERAYPTSVQRPMMCMCNSMCILEQSLSGNWRAQERQKADNLQGQMQKIKGSLAVAEYSSRKRQRRGEQRQLVAMLDMLLPPEARRGGETCRNLGLTALR
jgi:hypothetical protein